MACFSGMMRVCTVPVMVVVLAATSVQAVSAEEPPAPAAASFISSQGFTAVEQGVLPLEKRLQDSLMKTGAVSGNGQLTALEKALLLVDLEEKPLQRVRYVVRLGQQVDGGGPLTLVEVDRYNLGPASRAEAIEAYGEEYTADPEDFGVGPHVSWRFIMRPAGPGTVELLAAGRREVPEEEAAKASCVGRSCLSLDLIDDLKTWKDASSGSFTVPKRAYPAVIATGEGDERGEEEAPAHVALELALMLGAVRADQNGVQWVGDLPAGAMSASSLPVIVIDRNTGQETMTDAIMGMAGSGDGLGQRWVRRTGGVFDGAVDARFQTTRGLIGTK